MSQSQQATVSSRSPCGKAVVTWKVLGVGITWQSISVDFRRASTCMRVGIGAAVTRSSHTTVHRVRIWRFGGLSLAPPASDGLPSIAKMRLGEDRSEAEARQPARGLMVGYLTQTKLHLL